MAQDMAHDLLRRAVNWTRASGGRPYAAGLKPKMQTLARDETGEPFSEQALGYDTFRAFLESARAAGVVELVLTPLGNDVEVIVAGGDAEAAEVTPRVRRIRADLWTAFIRWPDGTVRLFDRQSERALIVDTGDAERRKADEPARYLDIEPFDRDGTRALMSEFLATVPEDERGDLQAVLDNQTPDAERDFVAALQSSPKRAHGWRSVQTEGVARRIEQWADANGLTLNPYVHDRRLLPRRHTSMATTRALQPRMAQRSDFASHRPDPAQLPLKADLIEILSRLPASELLRLRVPLEYVVLPERRFPR